MTREEAYWLGYRYGRNLAKQDHLIDHERTLKLEVGLATDHHRSYALGELRGYREAMNRPETIRHD